MLDQVPVKIPYVDLYFDDEVYPLIDRDSDGLSVVNPLFLLNFTYESNTWVSSGNYLTMTILDPQWDLLEGLLHGNRSRFGVEFGWRSVGNEDETKSFHVLLPLTWDVAFDPFKGSVVTISATDATYLLNTEASNFKADPNDLISTAIEKLYAQHGIDSIVTKTANTVGEEKAFRGNMSDSTYLLSLLKVARVAAQDASSPSLFVPGEEPSVGRNDYVVRTITRERKPLVIVGPDTLRPDSYGEYTYGRDRDGEVLAFTTTYNGLLGVAWGGVQSEATHIDPQSKEVKSVRTSQTEDPGSEEVFHFSFRDSRTNSKIWATPYRTLTDTEAYIRGHRAAADKAMYNANLTVIGDPFLFAGEQILVNILKLSTEYFSGEDLGDQDRHFMSGLYTVYRVVHTIAAGRYVTDIQCFRQTGRYGPVEVVKKVIPKEAPVLRTNDAAIPVSDLESLSDF